jgi:hypothetical protein
MKVYLVLFTLLLTFAACGHKDLKEKAVMADVAMAPPAPAALSKAGYERAYDKKALDGNATPPKEAVDTSKKIIKEGEIRFPVENLKATRQKIVNSLKRLGGYVAEENETTNSDNNQKEYDLKIRIPSKNFDSFLEALSADADHIDTKNIRRRDVTTEFIDIATQLKNKQLLEDRYLELLKKATKTSDLLQIEEKLAQIRTEIESTQGQLNYLSRQVAYSSLDITFYNKQTAQIVDEAFSYKFKTAVYDGWNLLQNLFFSTIMFWPFIFIAVIFYWMVKIWRKKKGKKAE